MADRHQQHLRLPRDIAERLEKEAQRQHFSVNTYIQMAIKERLERDKADRQERQAERRSLRGRDDAPRGLGLNLRVPRTDTDPPPPPPESPAPVVVNVGAQAAAGENGLIAGLADFVTSGPTFLREQRKRTAVEIIKGSAKSPAEREALARQLDAALEERKAQRPSAMSASLGSWFGQ